MTPVHASLYVGEIYLGELLLDDEPANGEEGNINIRAEDSIGRKTTGTIMIA